MAKFNIGDLVRVKNLPKGQVEPGMATHDWRKYLGGSYVIDSEDTGDVYLLKTVDGKRSDVQDENFPAAALELVARGFPSFASDETKRLIAVVNSMTVGTQTLTTLSTPKPIKKQTMNFKIGDRVRAKSNIYHEYGKVGTVRNFSSGYIGVEFDEYVGGHSLDGGVAKGGHGVNIHASDLELERSSPVSKSSKSNKVDTKILDSLVIAEDSKAEILSVLKQHTNADKIFKKWGLGETIEYGKGMTFLFHGAPGTGKTWAATLMARALGTDLITIGMAEIQSSEPGAANRNIQNAFSEAKSSGKVLFIDECDSLIYDRSQLGMVLAGEVNTLLQEIEKFEGVLILATNQINRMDQALERRISLIVEFAKPNLEQRKAIWQKLLPEKMPLHAEVTIDSLAVHELTGGLIKNVVLHAARMACADEVEEVSKDHFDRAIARVTASQNLMGIDAGQKARMQQDMSVGMGSNPQVTITRRSIDSFFKSCEDNV